jgi:protein subunit release factor A
MRELIFRTTIKDCTVQTFRAGGNGGQNQNKRDTGVRIIHRPSGARGESREERSQLQNKKAAFRRMGLSAVYRSWLHAQLAGEPLPESTSTARVRTYHFVERRVKDHRSGRSTSDVAAILAGDLDLVR